VRCDEIERAGLIHERMLEHIADATRGRHHHQNPSAPQLACATRSAIASPSWCAGKDRQPVQHGGKTTPPRPGAAEAQRARGTRQLRGQRPQTNHGQLGPHSCRASTPRAPQ
jgi:hypothetical protein